MNSIKRSFNKFKANSTFEKARLAATFGDDNLPAKEKDLQKILVTFRGEDPQTKAVEAYNKIIDKMRTSDSRFKWNYLLKNMIILDRVIEEGIFVWNIATICINEVETFKTLDQRYHKLALHTLVQTYYKFIKEKAQYYCEKNALAALKNKDKTYAQKCGLSRLLQEFSQLFKLLDLTFKIIETGETGHLKYKLCQYVFLLLLQFQMLAFTAMYMGIVAILDKVFTVDSKTATKCYEAYKQFVSYTEKIAQFTRNHQFIAEFQGPSVQDFLNKDRDNTMLNNIKEYIKMTEEKESKANGEVIKRLSQLNPRRLSKTFIELSPEYGGVPELRSSAIKKYTDMDDNEEALRNTDLIEIDPEIIELNKRSSVRRSLPINNLGMSHRLKQDEDLAESIFGKASVSDTHNKPKPAEVLSAASREHSFNRIRLNDKQFDNWNNFYSKDYSELYIEAIFHEYESNNYKLRELALKDPMHNIEFKNQQNSKPSPFSNMPPFNQKLFNEYANFYSSDFHSTNQPFYKRIIDNTKGIFHI